MNPSVDVFLEKAESWHEEFVKLRSIVLDCGLTEDFKWGCPCYSFQKNNVVLIHGFKNYCALLFFKGALLQDGDGILIQQTANVQAARQVRFTQLNEILSLEATLKAYIFEAVEIEKAGLEVQLKPHSDYDVPAEFQLKLDASEQLKLAFESLTPGRQRAYVYYFAEAKQAKTREQRVEKNLERILNGVGLNDCTCGMSHRKPNCDGTHKHLTADK